MRTVKTALQQSIVHAFLSLALSGALTTAAIATGGAVGTEICLGIGIFIGVLPWPALSVLASFPGRPDSYGLSLPAYGDNTRTVRGASLIAALSVLGNLLVLCVGGQLWPRLALVIVAVTIALIVTLKIVYSLSRIGHQRLKLKAAIISFAPEFVLYTGRSEGGAYQIQQWLPHLVDINSRVLIVVRHAEAAQRLAAVLPANVPIVCCRENSDLDHVMIPSVRAAFYVNSVVSNANLVSYRSVQHIYLGHGDSDKEISAHPVHRMYDAIFVAGRAAIDRYAEQHVRIDADRIHVVGRPQLAGVMPAKEHRPAPGTVLYAPTWSGYNKASSLSSLSYAQPFIADLLSRGFRVLFRPHPFSRFRGPDAGHVAAIDALLSQNSHDHLGSTASSAASIIDLFNISDAMLTDVSSLVVDYLSTQKPVAVLASAAPSRERNLLSGYCAITDPRFYPSIRHAYLPESTSSEAWRDFLGSDPLRVERAVAAAYYLGGTSSRLFDEAVRSLLPAAKSPD